MKKRQAARPLVDTSAAGMGFDSDDEITQKRHHNNPNKKNKNKQVKENL